MKLFLFSDSFPHGNSETFLESEILFLSKSFEKVIIIPLQKSTGLRITPANIEVWEPILNFSLKNKSALLKWGTFNFSPVLSYVKEFVIQRIYVNHHKMWNFFTSLLLARTLYSKKNVWEKLYRTIDQDDLIYFYWGDKSTLIIPYLKNNLHNKICVRFHRTDLYEYANNNYIPFRQIIFPHIDWFLPISEDGKNYLLEHYQDIISPGRIKLCRLGVFDHGINLIKTDYIHLVSCSHVVPVKRISLIVDALKYINIHLKWTHIGAGDGLESIKEKVKTLQPNIEVHLLGGLPNAEVINFYRDNQIDLFINVSKSEGVPVSIMEVLSFGIPVFATNVGGTSEIVDSEVGELLSPDVTDKELANKIEQFAKKSHSDMRKNARERWRKFCDAEENYQNFTNFMISLKK